MLLRNVEIFCAVAQHRNFSKGAAASNVSQPAASQAVHTLEQRLATQLIDRSHRPLALTPAGQVFFDGCRKILEQFRALEGEVRQAQDIVTGTVRVAAIYSVGLMQMDAHVRRFEELYPEAHLRVDYLHPDRVYERVLQDAADIGLVSFPRTHGELAHIAWQEQPMLLVVPPGHPLAKEHSVSVGELNGIDYIGFTEELTIRREVDRFLKRSKVSVQVVHVFDNIENIKRDIEIGSGVALLPEPTVQKEVAAGTLVAVRLADASLTRPLGIVHKRHKQQTNAVSKFIELLHMDPALWATRSPETTYPARKNGHHPAGGPLPHSRSSAKNPPSGVTSKKRLG